ncbi:BTB/POZ fold protein [Penicillium samsonianum]|uniref:BTB/POZ fold protein n=1 Tax=Penicillium samsonianum TaxID=1882272 RepID=UPI002546E539|nr:BTB/POZ fold protein [Penicillium samsonianum]KAJ6125890.1 BTB/POZ fold protein [Penicillium samsonianum]
MNRQAWNSFEQARNTILQNNIPVDYNLLCDTDVIFFGDQHSNQPIRDHLCAHAASLKSAGITHFAVEAPTLEDVPMSDILLCRTLAKNRISVLPVDIDQSSGPTGEEREAFIFNALSKILRSGSIVKVAVLIGSFHMSKKKILTPRILSTATRIESAGFSTRRLMFCGGYNRIPTIFTEPARLAGLGQKEFAFDARPYGEDGPFGGDADFIIHLAQSP